MSDLSNAEISVEGEYNYCLICGDLFHWEQLTNRQEGAYCDYHLPDDDPDFEDPDEADMGHDTALERERFGDAI